MRRKQLLITIRNGYILFFVILLSGEAWHVLEGVYGGVFDGGRVVYLCFLPDLLPVAAVV